MQLKKKSNAIGFNFQGSALGITPTVPKEEKYFTFIPIIFHQGLKSTHPKEFFALCRQANISFDISKRTGTLFFVPGDMEAGTLTVISISKNNMIINRGWIAVEQLIVKNIICFGKISSFLQIFHGKIRYAL